MKRISACSKNSFKLISVGGGEGWGGGGRTEGLRSLVERFEWRLSCDDRWILESDSLVVVKGSVELEWGFSAVSREVSWLDE